MTVAELIRELTAYDQGMEVVTGELRKPEVIKVIDRLVLKETTHIPTRPRKEELAAI